MKITNISATNFKGRSFSNPLAPITVLVGDNFAGKSSRTEALTVAIAGYLPGIEKTPGKIMDRLASADQMAVMAQFSDGRFMGREYVRDGSRTSCKVSQRGFHAAWAVEPAMIDASEFLCLSAKERVKYLASKLAVSGEVITPASLFAQLNASDIAKSEAAALRISHMENEVGEDYERAVKAGLPPQLWLENLGITMNDRRKAMQARSVELAKAFKVQQEQQAPMLALSPKRLEQAVREAIAERKVAQESLNDARVRLMAADSKPDTSKQERALAVALSEENQAVKAIEEAEAEMAEVDSMTCCPKCGAKNKGWQKKIKQAALENLTEKRKLAAEFVAKTLSAQEALKAAKAKGEKRSDKQAEQAHKEVADKTRILTEAIAKEEAAERELMDCQRQEAEIKAREKARNEAVAVNVEVEVLKEFCKLIQSAMDAMVSGSIMPLVQRINSLCLDVLPAPIAYEGGELGMQSGSGFISWRSFSGTEKALFHCAVSLALAAEAEIKLAVLDEVGRLDGYNKRKLCGRILALLTQGILEQAILIDAADLEFWQAQADECNQSISNVMAVVEIK